LGVSFKNPLLLNFLKHIIVSKVNKVAVRASVKVVCSELNLTLGDLPVLKGFDRQKSFGVDVLKLPNASHFAISFCSDERSCIVCKHCVGECCNHGHGIGNLLQLPRT
jgi:hypothetical protein